MVRCLARVTALARPLPVQPASPGTYPANSIPEHPRAVKTAPARAIALNAPRTHGCVRRVVCDPIRAQACWLPACAGKPLENAVSSFADRPTGFLRDPSPPRLPRKQGSRPGAAAPQRTRHPPAGLLDSCVRGKAVEKRRFLRTSAFSFGECVDLGQVASTCSSGELPVSIWFSCDCLATPAAAHRLTAPPTGRNETGQRAPANLNLLWFSVVIGYPLLI